MTLLSLLSPKARALVEAGRGAQRPTVADRERIQSALKSRLGAGAFEPGSGGALPSPAAAGAKWPLVSGVIAGVAAVGGVLFFALRGPSEPARAPEIPRPVITAPAVVVEESAAPAEIRTPPAPPLSAPVASEAPAPSTRSKQDRLAQEVALLSSATKSLNARRPAEALKVLAEHQRKFPSGLLTEERRAARAQALCTLGRVSEAKSELARLTPRSPAAARAQQVCDRAREQGR